MDNKIYIFLEILKLGIIFLFVYSIYMFKDKGYKIIKNKKMSYLDRLKYIKKLNIAIYDFKNLNAKSSKYVFLNNLTILIFSTAFSIVSYVIFYKILKIKSSALIIAILNFFLPYYILRLVIYFARQKILKQFPEYILNLKKYVGVSNNILLAFKNAKATFPLSVYIERFNISIEKGINVYDAFERLKTDINIEKITKFITIIENCYLNGGNFEKLLDRYAKFLINRNIQKEKQKQNSYSAKLVICILILINIYIIYSFIYKNKEYFNIMTQTIPGIVIVNFNILSYIFMIYMIFKINNEEE